MGGATGRPNPHEYSPLPPVSVRGNIANADAPAGGTGRGQSRDARSRHADAWWDLGTWEHRTDEPVGSIVHRGEQFVHHAKDELQRSRDLFDAAMKGIEYSPARIINRLGVPINELMRAFLPGIGIMLVILGATTLLGATVGASLGVLAGGAGALPGAAIGGDVGLDAGVMVLAALGIGFLLKDLLSELPKVYVYITAGVNKAWNAGHDPHVPESKDIEVAAGLFADALTEFMVILVEGLLGYLMGRAAFAKGGTGFSGIKDVRSLEGSAAIALRADEILQALRKNPDEVRIAFKESIAEFENDLLKTGRWAQGLVPWADKHFEALLDGFIKQHPRPAFATEEAGGGVETEAAGGGGIGKGPSSSPGTAATTTDDPSTTKSAGDDSKTKDNRIDISFDPDNSKKVTTCNKIVHVQFIRLTIDGKVTKPSKFVGNWSYRDAVMTSDGWWIDHLATEKTPDYQQGSGNGHKDASSSGKASIVDIPDIGGDTVDGPYEALTNPGGWKTVHFDFFTFAWCMQGPDCGKWYEGVKWQYDKTAAQQKAGGTGTSTIVDNNVTTAPPASAINAFDLFNQKKVYKPCSSA